LRYAVAVAAAVIAAIALIGWGSKVRQLTRLSVGGWPVTIGLGLGGVIFLGGFGNLFDIARAWAFNAVILLGLGLSALELRMKAPAALSWREVVAATHWYHAVLFVVVVAVGGFVISTALPPTIFNHHDDFEKYIPQVASVR
jgi:hypothetical protein